MTVAAKRMVSIFQEVTGWCDDLHPRTVCIDTYGCCKIVSSSLERMSWDSRHLLRTADSRFVAPR